jgi:hypothetical protein
MDAERKAAGSTHGRARPASALLRSMHIRIGVDAPWTWTAKPFFLSCEKVRRKRVKGCASCPAAAGLDCTYAARPAGQRFPWPVQPVSGRGNPHGTMMVPIFFILSLKKIMFSLLDDLLLVAIDHDAK